MHNMEMFFNCCCLFIFHFYLSTYTDAHTHNSTI